MLSQTNVPNHIFHPRATEIRREPVDLAVLAGYESIQLEGETDLVVQLIDLFVDEVPRRVRAMRDSVASRNPVVLKSAAHTLRGSSGSLGALQVARLCEEIEGLAALNVWSDIPSLLSWLEIECEIALHIFEEERLSRL